MHRLKATTQQARESAGTTFALLCLAFGCRAGALEVIAG